ncbi:hypothetical protein GIB67_041861 [Kingdonia uniflora]|uniref:Uncharacterized protein n=1 Tax=Kingdonia uniflora TaxID=39325 RepID=A0A7J7L611_9MAGN|nr:hypothetical protein GIB67_041861 [Kingdonia uniflora]
MSLGVMMIINFVIVFGFLFSSSVGQRQCSFNAIYQFGDSISDTGNLVREGPAGAASPFSHLPYGETFFGKPTGRCSNGLLMIDYLATAANLPFLNPYLDKNTTTFFNGVNFAVAGSTALNNAVLAQHHIFNPVTNSSLSVQLEWFRTHLSTICSTRRECVKMLASALFMVGEIGGNDYNYAFSQNKTIPQVMQLVPLVVGNTINAAREVIFHGARTVVVPGNFPIGCIPVYLTAFGTNNTAAYDRDNCLIGLNHFSVFHNRVLQRELARLRRQYPYVRILYADYYSAFRYVLHRADSLGFEKDSVLKACCGAGGDYNFGFRNMCGTENVTACPNPDLRLSWDGIHLTQKAYRLLVSLLLIPSDASDHTRRFDTIYQFGDSLSDTGNLIREIPSAAKSAIARYPYGETFFNKPTGRLSDGRLIIDYIAPALGLPLLNPYLAMNESFRYGVNFAVVGATALNTSFLRNRGIYSVFTVSSLEVQLEMFKTYLQSLANKRLDSALFIVGEIGSSDYAFASIFSKLTKDNTELVPLVIQKIKEIVGKLIELGATRVIVPGILPNGCIPSFLTMNATNDKSAYDKYGCLISANKISDYHNTLLQQALTELRTTYPHAVILYADYYTSFFNLIKNADKLGFEKVNVLKACCGTGGAYNFDFQRFCGTEDIPVQVCPDPNRRVSWDGIHLTQKAYSLMAESLIRDLFPKLS